MMTVWLLHVQTASPASTESMTSAVCRLLRMMFSWRPLWGTSVTASPSETQHLQMVCPQVYMKGMYKYTVWSKASNEVISEVVSEVLMPILDWGALNSLIYCLPWTGLCLVADGFSVNSAGIGTFIWLECGVVFPTRHMRHSRVRLLLGNFAWRCTVIDNW